MMDYDLYILYMHSCLFTLLRGEILILVAIVALRGLGYFMHGNMGAQLLIGASGLHNRIARQDS
jgi:hypothetical protein